ncbi:MAG: hypothetical protein INR62_07080 [Rhodospirillales bacterium]|nr:hypothetical protein [Acetobacter sp.]
MSGSSPGAPFTINLTYHERAGGHTLANHVGKSVTWLQHRLSQDLTIPNASTFPDLQTAEYAVNRVIQANLAAFQAWLVSRKHIAAFDHETGSHIGMILQRTPLPGALNPLSATKARVVVKKTVNAYASGFLVLTAFPIV